MYRKLPGLHNHGCHPNRLQLQWVDATSNQVSTNIKCYSINIFEARWRVFVLSKLGEVFGAVMRDVQLGVGVEIS
jgi:hypothetical protein